MNVTKGLLIINMFVFVVLEVFGQTESAEYLLKMGAVYPTCIMEDKEYWRLLTATFMHFGFGHLLNNMVMLFAAGQILERAIGKWKYLFLYLAAGVGGCTLSLFEMLYTEEYAVSAGASGSIFGIIGALAWIVIVHKGHYETLTGKGMLGMLILSLYYGISEGNVDNWGHIGGFLMGFLLCIILYRRNTKKIDFSEQNLYT